MMQYKLFCKTKKVITNSNKYDLKIKWMPGLGREKPFNNYLMSIK